MGGWLLYDSTSKSSYADADHPSPAKIARRREADLNFLAWVKLANLEDLTAASSKAKGWKLVAIQRRLKKLAEHLKQNER